MSRFAPHLDYAAMRDVGHSTLEENGDKIYYSVEIQNPIINLPSSLTFDTLASSLYGSAGVVFVDPTISNLTLNTTQRSLITDEKFNLDYIQPNTQISCKFNTKGKSGAVNLIAGIRFNNSRTKVLKNELPIQVGRQVGDYSFEALNDLFINGIPQTPWTGGIFDPGQDTEIEIFVKRNQNLIYTIEIQYKNGANPVQTIPETLTITNADIASGELFSFLMGENSQTASAVNITILSFNATGYSSVNENFESVQAVFRERRVKPILEVPKEYEVAVTQFRAPTYAIPIFRFQENLYSFSIQVGLDFYPVYVEWLPNSDPDTTNPDKRMYHIDHFLDMCNIAISKAYDDAVIGEGGPLPSLTKPFFTFESESQLITLNTDSEWYNNRDTLRLRCDTFTARLFRSFNRIYYGNDPALQRYSFVINKPGGVITEENPSVANWWDVAAIVIETYGISVIGQDEGDARNVKRKILWEGDPTEFLRKRTDITINPDLLDFHSLNTNFPLTDIDLRFLYRTRDGLEYPLIINTNQIASAKLLFRKIARQRQMVN